MSLQRFKKFEEEHGAMEGDAKKEREDNVRKSFSLFYLVALIMHGFLFVFSVIYYAVDQGVGAFAVCVSNATSFLDYYDSITLLGSFNYQTTNFTCVPEINDAALYLICIGTAAVMLIAGLLCHRYLPDGHRNQLMPYIDAFICPLVYMANIFGPFFAYFVELGHPYVLINLHGGRTTLGIGTFMCLWKTVTATLPFNSFAAFVVPQVIMIVYDLCLVIPAIYWIFNTSAFWFIVLDIITTVQIIYSAHQRMHIEAEAMDVQVKHVRLQALKFGAVEGEIVSMLLEECGLSDQAVEGRKFPWRLPDAALRLGQVIGQGSQAKVYAALFHGGPVAVKVMTDADCKESLRALAGEAAMLWSLQKHPFVLSFYGVTRIRTADFGRRAALVFEYCPVTLEVLLEADWEVQPGTVLIRQAMAMRQIAAAVSCLHTADIQHCDLKPDNVFYGQDGHVRVADFGISNKSTARIKGGAIRGDMGGRNSVDMVGTAGYITPALLRLREGNDIDDVQGMLAFNYERHDAFAFVVVAIQVLTGSLPYEADADPTQLMSAAYVQHHVEAALADGGIVEGFRECLLDLYRMSTAGTKPVSFAAIRDRLYALPPRTPCGGVFTAHVDPTCFDDPNKCGTGCDTKARSRVGRSHHQCRTIASSGDDVVPLLAVELSGEK